MSAGRVEVLIQEAYPLFASNRREETLASLEQAVSFAPEDPHALNTRGMILDSLGRHDQAFEDFEREIGIDSTCADALNNRGIHSARLGQFDRALACYERSLAIAPKQPQTLWR